MIPKHIEDFIDSFSAKITRPQGECFDASVSLGILLASEGFHVRLVKGSRDGRKHWWLVHRGIIIDPTSHQFEGYDEYVEDENGDELRMSQALNFDSIAGYLFPEST